MKLTSFSIVFVLIISPFLFIAGQQARSLKEDAKLRCYYDSVIDNAIQDAAFMLAQNIRGLNYKSPVELSEARMIAARAFYDSLCHAFDAEGNMGLSARIEACVPVLAFLGDESISLYALYPYQDDKGQTRIRHIWFPPEYYVGERLENRYSVRYTLGNRVVLFDHAGQVELEGSYEDFKGAIPLFQEKESFEELRLAAVRRTVERELSDYIKDYNRWALQRNLTVEFKFPGIADADWKRAITDVGLLVFAQGFPVIAGNSYEHYALGGARIIRKPLLWGYEYNGKLHYCRNDCPYFNNKVMTAPGFDSSGLMSFTTPYEAAKNGYYPCPHCRP